MSDIMTSGLRSETQVPGGQFYSSRTLRSFFDRSGMCMACLDTGMRLIEVNTDFTRQFGRSPAELDGSRFCDLLDEDVQGKVSRQLSYLLADQFPRFTEPGITFHQRGSGVFSGELTAIGVNGDAGIDNLLVLVRPEKGAERVHPSAERRVLLADLDVRILEGVAAGVSTIKLASMLYLSRGGIEYHVNVLMRRLKVKNRPALVSKAYSMGLLRPGWPPRVHPDHVKKEED
jgi:PAS domain S-box-containing protein